VVQRHRLDAGHLVYQVSGSQTITHTHTHTHTIQTYIFTYIHIFIHSFTNICHIIKKNI